MADEKSFSESDAESSSYLGWRFCRSSSSRCGGTEGVFATQIVWRIGRGSLCRHLTGWWTGFFYCAIVMLTFLVELCQADNRWKVVLRIWCWIKQLLRMALLQIKFQPLWRNRRCLCQSLLWLGGIRPALGITGWWTGFFYYAIVILTFLDIFGRAMPSG